MLTEQRKKKLEDHAANRQKGFVVVLEDIHDPHNAQAIVRTCDAFGIGDVYLIFDKETPFNPKRVGKASSSTANKWVNFHIFHSTAECFAELKKQGFTIIATALDNRAVSLNDVPMTDKTIALVMGNEHAGLSQTALDLADMIYMIPMVGMVQSLNVSVTAAIFMWEFTRQRKAGLT